MSGMSYIRTPSHEKSILNIRNLKKQTAFILLVLITLLMTMSTALATTYVKRIYDENKIYFYSQDEALNSGYIPCKVCRP